MKDALLDLHQAVIQSLMQVFIQTGVIVSPMAVYVAIGVLVLVAILIQD